MTHLPLFPLQTVLFPGGLLPLRVFEARYMDMVTRCLREDSVFGVNLIAEGKEVGRPAAPHRTGTSARIARCDADDAGILHVEVVGERRFRIERTEVGANGLLSGEVEWLAEAPKLPVPEDCTMLIAVLQAIMKDLGEQNFPPPQRFDDADWVGMRLAGVLPIPLRARQALLELELPIDRLQIIRSYLAQQGLKP
jgi:Lon protease-like protein